MSESELIVGALRNPHLRVFEELFSDIEDWCSQNREELLAYLRAKRKSGGRIGALPPTRVPAKPFQDCDVYHVQNLKGFSRSSVSSCPKPKKDGAPPDDRLSPAGIPEPVPGKSPLHTGIWCGMDSQEEGFADLGCLRSTLSGFVYVPDQEQVRLTAVLWYTGG